MAGSFYGTSPQGFLSQQVCIHPRKVQWMAPTFFSFLRFLSCSWSGSVSEPWWQRWQVILQRSVQQEAACWPQLCCEPDTARYVPRPQPYLLVETSGYGQIRKIFHNYLCGKHPSEYGNFGCGGHSRDGAGTILSLHWGWYSRLKC